MNPNSANERFYRTQEEQVGTSYVWGGKDPVTDGGLDCSGLVRYGLNQMGYDLDIMNADTFTKTYTTKVTGSPIPGDVRVLDSNNDGVYEHIQVLGISERINASGDQTNTINNPGEIQRLTSELPKTGEIRRINYAQLPRKVTEKGD